MPFMWFKNQLNLIAKELRYSVRIKIQKRCVWSSVSASGWKGIELE